MPSFARSVRPLVLALPLLALAPAAGVVGCSKPAARAPNPTKPISERRALDVIAKAVRKGKFNPVEGREVKTALGAVLVDVAIEGRKFGIAYQTEADRAEQTNEQLASRQNGGRLLVVEGIGKEEGAKFLVLTDGDYLYDDQIGEGHEQTAITAENALERDVTDFLVQARTKKWE